MSYPMTINWSKLSHIRDIRLAYRIIKTKDRHKAKYLVKAVRYYETLPCPYIQEMKMYNDIFFKAFKLLSANSPFNLKHALTQDSESLIMTKVGTCTLLPMNLHFPHNDKDVIQKLYGFNTIDRAMLIAKAILLYTYKEEDEILEMALLADFIYEYNNSADKLAYINSIGPEIISEYTPLDVID